MKKNFMTRALSVVLSAAMALSLSVVANVASADAAAAKPAFKKSTKTIEATKKLVKFYTTKKTKKNFTLTKVKTASADVKVSVNKAKQVVTVKRAAAELAADASATIKCTFKNKKTTKKVTKSVKVNVIANKAEEQVVVAGLSIVSAKVTKVNEITVELGEEHAADDLSATVAQNDTAVDTESVKQSNDGKYLVITTKSNLKGEYKVTVTSKAADNSVSANVKAEERKVADITFSNTVALTGKKLVEGQWKDNMEAYIYYDVVDQYGDSMKDSVSIQFTGSCKIDNKKNLGKLIVTKSDGTAWVYNDKVYITGVYTKTGVAVSQEFTIGTAQAVNKIKLGGFIKKGTTEKLTTLPKSFEDGQYFMLYTCEDQNGNDMEQGSAEKTDGGKTVLDGVTFISNNVLVIKEMTEVGADYTLDGVDYDSVMVAPGIRVSDGGEVTITAIANKTGEKTELTIEVGVEAVLKNFKIVGLKGMIADGESQEVSYIAEDAEGKPITSFDVMAKQETFNALSLATSDGRLTLAQQDDGTAKLTYTDKDVAWTESTVSDGIDRMVSLTAIVVGGESDNQMISIADKARPVAIDETCVKDWYIADSTFTLNIKGDKDPWDGEDAIAYIDQYNRKMGYNSDNIAQDNGFFAASTAGDIPGVDFAGGNYKYGIRVEYKGNGNITADRPAAPDNSFFLDTTTANGTITFTAEHVSASLGYAGNENIKLSIARYYNTADSSRVYDSVEKAKTITTGSVNIDKVTNFEMNTLNKQFVPTDNTSNGVLASVPSTGDGAVATGTAINLSTATPIIDDKTPYVQSVSVKAEFKGVKVNVPSGYVAVAGDVLTNTLDAGTLKLSSDASATDEAKAAALAAINASLGDVTLDCVSGTALKWDMLYNIAGTTGNYTRKDASTKVYVTVRNTYAEGKPEVQRLEQSVKLSDEKPAAVSLELSSWAGHTFKVRDTEGLLGNGGEQRDDGYIPWAAHSLGWAEFTVKDQYGVKLAAEDIRAKVTDLVEADGYTTGNLSVVDNGKSSCTIKGAEIGDTFKVVFSYKDTDVTLAWDYTVGADTHSFVDSNGNMYLGKNTGTDITYENIGVVNNLRKQAK